MLIRPTFSAARARVEGARMEARQRSSATMQMAGQTPRVRAERSQPFARRRRAPLFIVRSSSFHGMKLDRELFYFRLHDFFVIAIAHLDRIGVRTGFEHDVILLGEMLVDVSRQAVKIPKGRH